MKKRLLSALLTLCMVLTLLPVSGFATGGTTDPGIVLTKEISKRADDGTYTLTLEAYATGKEVTIPGSTVPLDIVLVLDQSGSMAYNFEGSNNGSPESRRQYAMKQAVNDFISSVEDNAADHYMAIVTFAGSASTVQGWTKVDASGAEVLKGVVNGLNNPTGATNVGAGMESAQSLITNSATGDNRQKVVIVFTDGVPTTQSDFNVDVANTAISAAKTMKDSDVTIYTVGIFNGADPNQLHGESWAYATEESILCTGEEDTYWGGSLVASFVGQNDFDAVDVPAGNRFLNYLSSNFLNSQRIGIEKGVYNPGNHNAPVVGEVPYLGIGWKITANASGQNDGYYLTANDSASLNSVFRTIADSIGSEAGNADLDETTLIVDEISPYFEVAEGEGAITVYTADKTNDGWAEKTAANDLSVSGTNGTVTVSGYDFAENYVSTARTDGTYGQKLIIEIKIKPVENPDPCSTSTIPTNGDAKVELNGTTITTAAAKSVTGVALTYDGGYGSNVQGLPAEGYYVPGVNAAVTSAVPTSSDVTDEDEETYPVTFVGWSETALGVQTTEPTCTIYKSGDRVQMPDAGKTLYAVWAKDSDGDDTPDYNENDQETTTKYPAGYFVLMPELNITPGSTTGYGVNNYYPNGTEAGKDTVDLDGDGVRDHAVDNTTGYIGYITGAAKDVYDNPAKYNADKNDVRLAIPESWDVNGNTNHGYDSNYLILPTDFGKVQEYIDKGGELVCYQINNHSLGADWPKTTQPVWSSSENKLVTPEYNGTCYHVDCYIRNIPVTVHYDANGGTGGNNGRYDHSGPTIVTGSEYEVLSNDTVGFRYDGRTFLGWATSKTATTPTYSVEQIRNGNAKINPLTSETVLYAVWGEPTTGTLEVTKSVSPTNFELPANFAIVVKDNDGAVVATLKYGTGTDANGTYYSTNGKWTISGLTAGTYTISETSADVTGYTLTKTGEGSVTVPAGGKAEASLTNTYTETKPDVSAKKTAVLPDGKTTVQLGDTIQYKIEIEAGTGNMGIMKNFSVTDTKFSEMVTGSLKVERGNVDINYALNNNTNTLTFTLDTPLGENEAITITYSYKVTEDDVKNGTVKNEATVQAWNEDGAQKSKPETPETTTTVDNKIHSVVKSLMTSEPAGLSLPDGVVINYPDPDGTVWLAEDSTSVTLLYQITVTGDPGVSYKLKDDGAYFINKIPATGAVEAVPNSISGQISGDPVTWYAYKTVTLTDAAKTTDGQQVTNRASVGNVESDEVKTTVKVKNPAVELEKKLAEVNGEDYVAGSKVSVDDTLTFTIEVKNVGNVPISLPITIEDTIKIADEGKAPQKLTVGQSGDTLEVGYSVKVEYEYKVPEEAKGAPIENSVKLSTTGIEGEDGSAIVTVYNPDLEVEKTARDQNGDAILHNKEVKIGDMITYEIKIKNMGDQELTNVVVYDYMWKDATTAGTIKVDGVGAAAGAVDVTDGKVYLGSLGQYNEVTITFDYKVNVCHLRENNTLTNTAYVTNDQREVGSANATVKVAPQYKVTVNVRNGTAAYGTESGITGKTWTVNKGDDMSFTFNNDPGYALDTVTVNGSAAQLDEYNSYSFTNISGDCTIIVVYETDKWKDDPKGDSETGGDGIPDKYQVKIQYVSSDASRGTVTGTKLEIVTLKNADGTYASRGSVTASGSSASANSGYRFSSWTNDAGLSTVYSSELSAQTIKDANGGSTYTFTANFSRRSTGSSSSSSSGSTSKPELNKEDHFAYVSGYPDGTVQPNDYITREEVATIFFRLLTDKSRADYITEWNPFPDITSSRWSFYSITTMNNGELMVGRNNGLFDPSANITRAEFAVVAAQFSDAKDPNRDYFTDVSGHWAESYINRAASVGWIAGYPDGTFRPDQPITRAEVMALVNEVLERAPHEDHMLRDMIHWPDNRNEDIWYYEDVQEATNAHTYVWTSVTEDGKKRQVEDWQEIVDMPTYDELVRAAFLGKD